MSAKHALGVSGLLIGLLAGAQSGDCAEAIAQVSLVAPTTDTVLSGFKGTPFTLGAAGSSTHALYGITNWEQSDDPCKVTVRTESIMSSQQEEAETKTLCDGRTPGDEIKVAFEDTGPAGSRAFITGVRVCMNNDQTKVKGINIRGKKLTNAGDLVELEDITCMVKVGNSEQRISCPNAPSVERPNCDDNDGWKKWAECPNGSVATAAVVHFDAGSEPRSLTGIALKCRSIKHGVPAAAR